MPHILYPSSPLSPRKPDEQFAAEIEAAQQAGFEISLFSLENFQNGEFRAVPPIPPGATVLYRGWMLSASDYEALVSELARLQATPVTSLEAYLASHFLPHWYPLIPDLTPETRVFPRDCDLEKELAALAWPEYFIKDYVKSLKTSVGSRISKPEQVPHLIQEMQRFRGVIEGGFCVRRVENFLPGSEQRYFVLDGIPHAHSGDVPSMVHECAKRLKQRFYSVDVVQRTDGQPRIVEVGDGQVSDLVGWTPERFAEILARHFGHSPG